MKFFLTPKKLWATPLGQYSAKLTKHCKPESFSWVAINLPPRQRSEGAWAVTRRFSAVERILDSQRPSDIYCCCLDLSMVPFEKVLCQIPFSIVTRDRKVPAAAAEIDLWLDKDLR